MKYSSLHSSSVTISIPGKDGVEDKNDHVSNGPTNVSILFWNISSLSKLNQTIICCSGILLCYIPYGYLQELMFKNDGFKYHGWYLTLYQFLLNASFAFMEQTRRSTTQNRAPLSSLFVLASLTVATMGLSNTAVGYLNYPTQVIFKCCKLIPVMIAGIIIQGKKYGPLDFISMFMLSVGLIFFMLADKKVSPEFNMTGVILICMALVADSMIGNSQEKVMKTYGTSNVDMIFYSYGIGFFYILVGCLITGKFFSAFKYFALNPVETYGYGFLFSLCGYVGMQMVLAMILSCGALATVTFTTFRKAISIILSFLLISKPFIWQYVWAGAIVLIGIIINVYSKNKSKFKEFHQVLCSWPGNFLKYQRYSNDMSAIV